MFTQGPAFFGAVGGVPPGPPSIGDVFDIDLYTGNGGTSRSVASVDLSGGGIAWIKSRNQSQAGAFIYSPNGASPQLIATNSSLAATAAAASLTGTGFSLTDATFDVNTRTYVAWSLKKAAGFLDIVNYTGNGSVRNIAHSLGVAPAMIITKRTDSSGSWFTYHNALGAGKYFSVSAVGAGSTSSTFWDNTAPTSSVFTVGTNVNTNNPGASYTAFLFAHDTGPDGLVQGFSYVGNGSATGPVVSLGWQPQWVLIFPDSSTTRTLVDTTRSPGFTGSEESLPPEASGAASTGVRIALVSGGFQIDTTAAFVNGSGTTYFGLAIRAP